MKISNSYFTAKQLNALGREELIVLILEYQKFLKIVTEMTKEEINNETTES